MCWVMATVFFFYSDPIFKESDFQVFGDNSHYYQQYEKIMELCKALGAV